MKQICSKLTKIMKDCSYVQKTGYNDFHRYKYAKAADILEKANESMVENNVASKVIPKLIEFRDVTTAKGATEHLATVEITVTLIDNDSGESIDIIGIGSGQDAGDKAVMKAQTAAIKYAWMLSLNISTGDDPEADEKTDTAAQKQPANTNPPDCPAKPPAASPATKSPCSGAQQRRIETLWQELGRTEATLKKELQKSFGVDAVSQLGVTDAVAVIKSLNELVEKAKKQNEPAS